MDKNTVLHFVLLFAVIALLMIVFKWPRQKPSQPLEPIDSISVTPLTAPTRQDRKSSPLTSPPSVLPRPFRFPVIVGRTYAAPPQADDRRAPDLALADGNIEGPSAPSYKVSEKQIGIPPTTVVFQWVFSLP